MKITQVFVFLLFGFVLSACASYTKNEQPAHPDFVRITEENQLGQTFSASYDGLNEISLFLKASPETSGELTLTLYPGSTPEQAIRTALIKSAEIDTAGLYNFTFNPIDKSSGEDYLFELSYAGPGNLRIGSSPGNSYLSGAQYLDGIAQNAQTTFRSSYSPTPMLLGLIAEGFTWMGYFILATAIFILPGWSGLSWLLPTWKNFSWISKSILSIGLGISVYPVFFLWMDTVGIHSSFLNIFFLPILGIALILVHFFRSRRASQEIDDARNYPDEGNGDQENINHNFWVQVLPDLAFVLLLGLLILTRFWPVRNLDAPMWGDSYQHTMIAQLLADANGLFSSWEPYARLSSFTYHFGFHSLVANFHGLSGISVIQSTLWIGQILNIFAVIAIYPLANRIGKNRWAGVMAVLIAGFVSSMPMAYVNWGRYTQLAGLIILPVIILIAWQNLDSRELNLKWTILVWFGLAGLALTHYRVTIFVPLFYLAYFAFHLRKNSFWNLLKITLMHAAGVIFITFPWLFRLVEGTLPKILGAQLNSNATSVSQATQDVNAIGSIYNYLPQILWLLIVVSIIWGIATRNKKILIFSFWWLLILLAANPGRLGLPGTGVLTNFAVFIAAYIPAGILIGSSISSVVSKIGEFRFIESGKRVSTILSALLLVVILFTALWFVRPRIRDVRPAEHILLARPDLRAAEWIDLNLPEDAKILVNSFFAYGGTLVAGADGGWWLPLLTGRDSSQPPLTYGSESSGVPDYVGYINSLVSLIDEKGITSPEVLSELQSRDITHIYIGQQQGMVNNNSDPLLDLSILSDDPRFSVVYNKDRVWVFEINYTEG